MEKKIINFNDEPSTAYDKQVGGDHYKKMAIQPLEYAMANKLGPAETLCLRYISRWRNKNGIEDIDKAIHCLQLLKEFEIQHAEKYER